MPPSQVALSEETFRVLLVEDDDGDAFLVEELLVEADEHFDMLRARSIAEAISTLGSGGVNCILLDLGLPDATGLEGVKAIVEHDPSLPIIVLTGHGDNGVGLAAVAGGAQDYLIKGHVGGSLLGRAIRYAVQRRAVDDAARLLREAQHRRAENARLARGLLPHPVVFDNTLACVTRYRPSGQELLLGGDFFDAVELRNGVIRAMVGDVCGHGPEEAALGVAMRVGWRALVLADCPEDDVFPALETLVQHERHDEAVFTTMCELTVAADRRTARVRLAGHPPPLLVHPELHLFDAVAPGLPLGLDGAGGWASFEIDLGLEWTFLLYTDGVFEGHSRDGARLGLSRFVQIAGSAARETTGLAAFLDRLVKEVESEHGGPLADDIALLGLAHTRGPRARQD
jgi:serine phosphatase RsbU (regulator of sigma subunit)